MAEIPHQALTVQCAHCNRVIFSTRGTTDQEQVRSLLTNVANHVNKSHSQQNAQVQQELAEAVAALAVYAASTHVEWMDTPTGVKAKTLFEAALDEASTCVLEFINVDDDDEEIEEIIEGTEDDEEDDEEASDEIEEELELQEGVKN